MSMEKFNYGELEAATKGFSMDTLVGKGSHGLVYKGVLSNGKHVAVKKPSPWLQQSGGQDASGKLTEAEILGSIRSPHVVNLIGISFGREEENLLVMEFMPNGSLHHLLHESPEPPTWPRRLMLALQVAQALQALHTAGPPVVHRDVKSSNVLLGSQGDAKLADFSLAIREAGLQPEQVPAGTIGYMDPCYTGPTRLSVRNDIYSYGVLLLELISGRLVMDAASDTTSLVAWAVPLAKSGLVVEVCDSRTPLPCMLERAMKMVIGLAIRCVSTEASVQRPSAGEIVAELQTVVVEQLRRPPMWIYHIRSNVCKGIQTWMKVWRRRKRSKLLATTILCEDHAFMDDGLEGETNRRKNSYRCRIDETTSRRSFRHALL